MLVLRGEPMTPRTKKMPVVRQKEASEFADQIADPRIQTAVNMALSRTILATVPTQDLAGNLIPPIETSETLDLLFLAKLYFRIFRRKQLLVDVLSRTDED
jgi:hypothetical protein